MVGDTSLEIPLAVSVLLHRTISPPSEREREPFGAAARRLWAREETRVSEEFPLPARSGERIKVRGMSNGIPTTSTLNWDLELPQGRRLQKPPLRKQLLDQAAIADELDRPASGRVQRLRRVNAHFRVKRGCEILGPVHVLSLALHENGH